MAQCVAARDRERCRWWPGSIDAARDSLRAATRLEGPPVTGLLNSRETVIYGGLATVFKRNVLREAREIRRRALWSADEMETFRLRRFREVLQHAQETVPYYRDLF